MEKQQLTHIINAAFANGCLHSLHQHARPREHTQNNHREIIPEGYAISVLRRSEACHVVEAQEGIDKIHAVHSVHSIIPGRSKQKIEHQAANHMHMQNLAQLARNHKI